MKANLQSVTAIVSLVLILIGINCSIAQKKQQLATGTIVYLKLRPVDPRSLMQGDYMALRFEMADKIIRALPKSTDAKNSWRSHDKVAASDGFVVVSLDDQSVATYQRLYEEGSTLASNELKLRYRIRNDRVKFATNAFFFQEGTGHIYDKAKYGQFRVDNKGELLLAAMFDMKLVKLESDDYKMQ